VAGWYSAAFPDASRLSPARGESLALDGDVQDAVLRCPRGGARLGIGPDLRSARRLTGAG